MRKIFIKTTINACLVLVTHTLLAQQDDASQHPYYLPSTLNPAYAGLDQAMNARFINRLQWVGLSGAPATQTLMFSTPVHPQVGIGTVLMRNQWAGIVQYNWAIDAAYLLQMNDEIRLSFGMKSYLQFARTDNQQLLIRDDNDPQLAVAPSTVGFNMGLGAVLYTDRWYAGLSTLNLFRTPFPLSNRAVGVYAMGGMNFHLKDNLHLKPELIVRSVSGEPITIDISTTVSYQNQISGGLAFRRNSAFYFFADYALKQVVPGLTIGYSYGFSTTVLSRFNSGTHEISLSYRFKAQQEKTEWLY